MMAADINRLELRSESLECIEMFLNAKGVPTKDDHGEFSVIGRVLKLCDMSYREGYKDGIDAVLTAFATPKTVDKL